MESAEIVVEEVKEIKVPAPIMVDAKSQFLVARDNSELVRMIKIFMNGQSLPKSLDTEAKVITAWQAAASLGIPPIIAIQNMAIIHGTLSMWGQLPKGLAEKTGQMEEFKLIFFDGQQREICLGNKNLHDPVWGAVTQMRRNKRAKNEYYFTEIEAQAAGLLSKAGPWRDYRKTMYARRTTAHAVKFEFPDALMGISVAEYDLHEAPDLKDVTRSTLSEAQDIAKRIASMGVDIDKKTCNDSMSVSESPKKETANESN